MFIYIYIYVTFNKVCVCTGTIAARLLPWYNRHGWLGIKNQLSICCKTGYEKIKTRACDTLIKELHWLPMKFWSQYKITTLKKPTLWRIASSVPVLVRPFAHTNNRWSSEKHLKIPKRNLKVFRKHILSECVFVHCYHNFIQMNHIQWYPNILKAVSDISSELFQ